MAIVVIGGLITSTFLSLLVIPVLFTVVDDVRTWVLKRLRRKESVV
jgi:Cu/Ag efflux pump CusA